MIEDKLDVNINTMFQKLPLHLKREILDYIEFLSNKYRLNLSMKSKQESKSKKKFKFDWEGGLANNYKNMTAVELQHKAMDWR